MPEEIPHSVNLKCDPERAIDLRDRYEDIIPGFHMNKRHWNTLALGGRLPTKLVRELIDHSYQLVVASLTRKVRDELGLNFSSSFSASAAHSTPSPSPPTTNRHGNQIE